MASLLRQVPTKFLVTRVISGFTSPIDTLVDETSQFHGYPYTFQVNVAVDIQTHSGEKTREPFIYDTNDIKVGDWLAQPTGKTYIIKQIVEILDPQNATLIIEDENLYNLKSDPSQQGNNYPDEEQPGAIFELDEDGNPILAGITNQSGQFPGLVYWIEDIKSRFEYYQVDEEGVEVDIDYDQAMNAELFAEGTSGNESPTGITIEYTPYADSRVEVKINGIAVNLGNGVKTKDCYFSNDAGATAKLIKDITAGDELFWNGINAGFSLDPADDIDFTYEASNLDI
jgi:hypothetical protein